MGMSIPYTETGRTTQKLRTRDALVAAARDLITRGLTPTVEDAAAEASISRTTAYRYFRNQREILAAAYPIIDRESLLGDDPPTDVAERLDRVVHEHLRFTMAHEAAFRAALRLSLDPSDEAPLLRRGRVVGWVSEALEPLRTELSDDAILQLARAIRATTGIESMIWLTDVAGMTHDEAVELMRWSAQALLQAARS